MPKRLKFYRELKEEEPHSWLGEGDLDYMDNETPYEIALQKMKDLGKCHKKLYLGREQALSESLLHSKSELKLDYAFKKTLDCFAYSESANVAWMEGGIENDARFKIKPHLNSEVIELIKSIKKDLAIKDKEQIFLEKVLEKYENNPDGELVQKTSFGTRLTCLAKEIALLVGRDDYVFQELPRKNPLRSLEMKQEFMKRPVNSSPGPLSL